MKFRVYAPEYDNEDTYTTYDTPTKKQAIFTHLKWLEKESMGDIMFSNNAIEIWLEENGKIHKGEVIVQFDIDCTDVK